MAGRRLLAGALLAAGCAAQAAGVAYDEAVRGDLAAMPADGAWLTLGSGKTTVGGTLWVTRDPNGAWRFDADNFRFALGQGLHLDAIAVTYAFAATGAGTRGGTVRHTLRLGGDDSAVYAEDIDSGGSDGAQALFDEAGRFPSFTGSGVREFSIGWPHLGAFGGSELRYRYAVTFDVGGSEVTVDEVPEPATPALAGAALALATAVTRRRRIGPR